MSNKQRYEMLCEKLGFDPSKEEYDNSVSYYIDDNEDHKYDAITGDEAEFMADYLYEQRTGIKVLA